MGMWKRLHEAYRWRRLLSSCRLDPRSLPVPLEHPGSNDFIIAGCPRTGTSLVAATLFQPPDVLTVMEPWDGLRMPPADLFASLRSEINNEQGLARGRLDLDALQQGRVRWQGDGARAYPVSVSSGYQLGVKWPTFWQYLELLPHTRFVVTLRDPVEVVSSFARIGGRLAQGLEYDVTFNAELNASLTAATRDPALRAVLLYEYINRRIMPHLDRENVFVVRYQRWFQDADQLLSELSSFLDIPTITPNVIVESPEPRELPPDLTELIDEFAPVARDLGYEA